MNGFTVSLWYCFVSTLLGRLSTGDAAASDAAPASVSTSEVSCFMIFTGTIHFSHCLRVAQWIGSVCAATGTSRACRMATIPCSRVTWLQCLNFQGSSISPPFFCFLGYLNLRLETYKNFHPLDQIICLACSVVKSYYLSIISCDFSPRLSCRYLHWLPWQTISRVRLRFSTTADAVSWLANVGESCQFKNALLISMANSKVSEVKPAMAAVTVVTRSARANSAGEVLHFGWLTFADVRCNFLLYIYIHIHIHTYMYIYILPSLLEKPGVLPAAKLSELKPEMVLEEKVVEPV